MKSCSVKHSWRAGLSSSHLYHTKCNWPMAPGILNSLGGRMCIYHACHQQATGLLSGSVLVSVHGIDRLTSRQLFEVTSWLRLPISTHRLPISTHATPSDWVLFLTCAQMHASFSMGGYSIGVTSFLQEGGPLCEFWTYSTFVVEKNPWNPLELYLPRKASR